MMIEKKSYYAYRLTHTQDISFRTIKEIASWFIKPLSEAQKKDIYNRLERGVALLDDEEVMFMYIFSYGDMHHAKLKEAFGNMGDSYKSAPDYAIVDYGCGQGLASVVLHDRLKAEGLDQRVRKVILVEPSKTTLSRAALHASVAYPQAEIVTVNKFLNDLTVADISSSQSFVFHLFSNILDVEGVSIDHLANVVREVDNPQKLLVCVGPKYDDSKRDHRVEQFCASFDAEYLHRVSCSKGEWIDGKDWTCLIRVLQIHEIFSPELKKVLASYPNSMYYNAQRLRDAQRGNMDALFDIGTDFAHEQNYEEAIICWRHIVKKGRSKLSPNLLSSLYCNFGVSYYYGYGVKQDEAKAAEYYKKGADLNHPFCQYNYAVALERGCGVLQNKGKAIAYYRMAAEQGVDMAINALIRLGEDFVGYRRDSGKKGVDPNMDKKKSMMVKWASLCEEIGRHLIEWEDCYNRSMQCGQTVKYIPMLSNFDYVINLIDEANSIQPEATLYYAKAEMYRFNGDEGKAIQYYKESLKLDNGDAKAWGNLGVMYYNKKMDRKALECFLKSIEIMPSAMMYRNLSNVYSVLGDEENAIKYYYLSQQIYQ